MIDLQLIQGSNDWLELRKTKITATDANVLMGVSPWKNESQLYYEKISEENNNFVNAAMQRGTDLEPIARSLFTIKTGIDIEPRVVIKDWAMASLDGISEDGQYVVEIKCPGEKDHALALLGKIPDHYYPQLQHQMYVCDIQLMFYFSFDGADGVIVEVPRNEEYIQKMIVKEKEFFDCIVNRIPPEKSKDEYIERRDELWIQLSLKLRSLEQSIKKLETEEDQVRNQLIFLAGGLNSKGGGISLCQIQRKGNIDYSLIEELKGIDLEQYRKPSSSSWRIT